MSFPFKIPFASSGDQSTVPDSDLAGSVNFTDGYTPDYQADPSLDPNAKLIERDKFNFLMNKITGAVGEIQRQGTADWYADLAPYDLNTEVFHNGKHWRSTIANNSATPGTGPEWLDVTPGTAAAMDAANPAEAQALVSLTKVITPGTLGDALNAHVLGMGQTWQNVTASRAADVMYTNTTGRAIAVSIWAEGTTASTGNSASFLVDGVPIYASPAYSAATSFVLNNVVVPNGATYRLDNGGFTAITNINSWVELR